MSRAWDQVILLDAQVSATVAVATSTEIPADAEHVQIQFTQSGTASVVTVQGSLDDSGWRNLFSAVSATLHAVTSAPRYVRAFTENTADAHTTVILQYSKP